MKTIIENLGIWLDKTFKGLQGKIYKAFAVIFLIAIIAGIIYGDSNFWYWFLLISCIIVVVLPVLYVFIRQIIVRPDK